MPGGSFAWKIADAHNGGGGSGVRHLDSPLPLDELRPNIPFHW